MMQGIARIICRAEEHHVANLAVPRVLPCRLQSASAPAKPFEQTADEKTVFELTNQERKNEKLPALKLNTALSKIARAHSENMARQGKMAHELDGKTPFDRIKATGYKYEAASENIAEGEDGAKIADIMKMWMESERHRKNILSKAFSEVGIGIARDKDGNTFYTQVFAKPR